jgi:hypothetical protein
MADTVLLDGREFSNVSQQITAAQNDYIYVQLNDCGASRLLKQVADGKRSDALAHELLLTILRSGMASQLLAGLLTEKGKKWTRIEADRNAAIFAEITDNEEKVRMRTGIVEFVFGFFLSGEVSSTTSPKSSNPNEKDPAITSAGVATSASSPESSGK